VENEKKLITAIALLFLSLAAITAYAHSPDNYEVYYMDEMHEEFVKNIEDQELKESFNEMHDNCAKYHGENL